MGNDSEDLKDKTLAQLEALRGKLADVCRLPDANDEFQRGGAGAEFRSADPARRPYRPARGIRKSIDAYQAELNDAIAGIRHPAASALLKVIGQVLAVVAR